MSLYEPENFEEKEIKKYITNAGEADLYDKLIQMCDALATDYGFVILEKRFVDVTRRYGIMEDYIRGWDITLGKKKCLNVRWDVLYMMCCQILERLHC